MVSFSILYESPCQCDIKNDRRFHQTTIDSSSSSCTQTTSEADSKDLGNHDDCKKIILKFEYFFNCKII